MRASTVLSLVTACRFENHARDTADASPGDGPQSTVDASKLDDGLIAWYRMDLLTASVDDASGHGHIGTCSSCPAVVPGKIGAAYDFSSDRIDVAETPELVTSSAFTVTMWVQFDTLPGGGYACVVSKGQVTGFYNTWQLCYEASSQSWMFGSQGATFDFLSSAPGPALDTWHHAAIRWDGTMKELWIDGAMRVSRAQTNIRFDGKPITIGADIDNNSTVHHLDGFLDEVRIYKRALAPSEIAALAN